MNDQEPDDDRQRGGGMRIVPTILCAAALSAVAAAQETAPERAFVAAGKSCDEINWARRTLRLFPNIATACREVVAREGQYYVRLQGEVLRVSGGGRQVTVRLAGGDLLTMAPPRDVGVYVNGRRTSPRDLREGDRFDFYVPQDNLAVTFYVENPGVAPVEAPIVYQQREEEQ
jgi:hypothetical protein